MPATSHEIAIAALILGDESRPSPLATDGYKFSMGQAGFPLRPETFYLSLRRGGPMRIPFDIEAIIRAFIPRVATAKEAGFLQANGYGMTPAMESALSGEIKVTAAPKGSWVGSREPICSITGPSFLVSWLEPLVIALNFPIQIATAMMNDVAEFEASCEAEAEIIQHTAMALDIALEPQITINPEGFRQRVARNVEAAITALDGDADRGFEAGMRAMTCMQQHRMVLDICWIHGLLKTSNVKLAYDLYMIPVGTTGHEHQCRWGNDDDAYRAIRDRRAEPPSYLPDTHDAVNIGIPAAIKVMSEDPMRRCSIRLDSGDQPAQLAQVVEGTREFGLKPIIIFADGYNAAKTMAMEDAAEKLGIPAARRMYCYGGFLVSEPLATPYTRNAVAAVYKLCQTGGRSVMKQSEPGKESLPGVPVILRSCSGQSMIAQAGELVDGYHQLTASWGHPLRDAPPVYSPLTIELIARCSDHMNL